MPNDANLITNLLIGSLAGFFGGLLGIGGGIVIIPLLVKFRGLEQKQAHGNSLLAQVFVALIGTVIYALNGSIDLMASLLIAPAAMITARSGAHYAHALPEWKLKRFFGGFIIIVSVALLLKTYLFEQHLDAILLIKFIVLLMIGVFTGFLSGMMGVGGAFVMIPAMALFLGLDQHTAQGSSLLVMVPVGLMGAWVHRRLGNVDERLLLSLVPGLLIGAYMGGTLAHQLSGSVLRSIFVSLLIVTGIRYLMAKPQDES
jgi:uncharacterized membrane protein YfcA